VLNGVTLAIAPGDMVALTGAPGSGKTTLLETMAGIHAPDAGSARLSGMEASAIPASERARYVAWLPMTGMILRGSIMDNLTGFDSKMRAHAIQVAQQLGIEQAISLLPSGYDTPMEGYATDVVPPGLKQRIAIARALLRKPRLILFDHADHGMDQESYVRIFEILARLKGHATIVAVTEDRNILSLADHVYALREGRLEQTAVPSIMPANNHFIMAGANL
jgi:ATP-binding cassette subfamily C protein LapB